MELQLATAPDLPLILTIIGQAKAHLKAQGIDQWQQAYPDAGCIQQDIDRKKGYLIQENADIIGYVCLDFDGEPAYDTLDGQWSSQQPFMVMHRMALSETARGKRLARDVFTLAQQLAKLRGVTYCRVDTDGGNLKMQHLLTAMDFQYCGTILFDNSPKLAYDKVF